MLVRITGAWNYCNTPWFAMCKSDWISCQEVEIIFSQFNSLIKNL